MTMPISTDFIVIIILSIFFLLGWRKGFFRSIIGPLALIIASIFSVQYYIKTQNIPIALLISILGPSVIHLTFILLLNVWHLTIDDKKDFSTLSRFSGGALSTFWRGSLFILTLILITIIPSGNFVKLKSVQDNIVGSKTYIVIAKAFKKFAPNEKVKIESITNLISHPDQLKKLESTKQYQDLAEDKTFQEIFQDEEFLELAKEQNIPKLLAHPNMKLILQDKNLVQKLMAFQKQMIEESLGKAELDH